MGKTKIVIDTNNYIAALGWEGKSRLLLQRVLVREFEAVISLQQLLEIHRVLRYPKLAFSEKQRKAFMAILVSSTTIIDTHLQLDVSKDPDDNMLLACAVESGAEFLISGDRHLKEIGKYQKVGIVSVDEFLRTHP